MKEFTVEEVAKHNAENDCWLIVDGGVYDVTAFLDEHPGGKKILVKASGKDATKQFDQFHKRDVLAKIGSKYQIGKIVEKKQEVVEHSQRTTSTRVPEGIIFINKVFQTTQIPISICLFITKNNNNNERS